MKANEQLFQMLKEDDVMCDALREFFKDELQDANDNGIKIGTANGTAIGKAEAIIEFLEEKGEVPAELAKVINSQKDLEVLKQWIKFAARAGSIEEFEGLIGLVK